MKAESELTGIVHVSQDIEFAETQPEAREPTIPELREDLQKNYTDHLRSIENTNLEMVRTVVRKAEHGFTVSLLLNTSSFVLGLAIIVVGIFLLINSPQTLGQTIGIVSSLIGLMLVITLLFWRGPLDKILQSAADLAGISAISLGLAHRLNQISRVFVHRSLAGRMDVQTLEQLDKLAKESVRDAVKSLGDILSEETAEERVQKLLTERLADPSAERD